MSRMYVLDVPENEGVVKVAGAEPDVDIEKVGPYFRITRPEEIVIDRRATGCRHAVWYSSLAGLEDSRVAQHDKDALRVVDR
ncbi:MULTISPECIES: hypothetical protein [Tsukamurella]|uniref:Uncharacterized protein n=2 Tax=Tsukamurella TaxID=2060 RepID=A0A5C5RUN6_9ACTN|nr:MULTISPECIES: hypothetical protein [Tsukamurella]NMD56297.1 hypothetical protein [Tsukamurella columbiensis]TWS26736.1 hypothetical protein FK530_22040 [Tsukamurella conjunctivitidis]